MNRFTEISKCVDHALELEVASGDILVVLHEIPEFGIKVEGTGLLMAKKLLVNVALASTSCSATEEDDLGKVSVMVLYI